ncbi:MAG: hypothetical protein IPK18_08250 [Sphingobacteriales bacterium]|jgi:hypothetical protein|nr:MAG: hypothetical protein IPK18_08250 [Sphingobacteriales bacterium]
MKIADNDNTLIDSYYSLIKNLSADNKLELIAKLSKSLRSTEKLNKSSWKSLYGSMELDEPIEDFITELKKDRSFIKKAIKF